MSSKKRILAALRRNQPAFDSHRVNKRRKVVNIEDTSVTGLQTRFIAEAETLGCAVYLAESADDAINHIIHIIGDDRQVLAWEDTALPFALSPALQARDVTIASPDNTQTRVGITGVDAALAATGSLIVQTRHDQARTVSLLPDHHIALVKRNQLVSDLETWVDRQRDTDFAAFKASSNTVIISGPSKTADIAQELIKGAHGPRKVHIILLE